MVSPFNPLHPFPLPPPLPLYYHPQSSSGINLACSETVSFHLDPLNVCGKDVSYTRKDLLTFRPAGFGEAPAPPPISDEEEEQSSDEYEEGQEEDGTEEIDSSVTR